MGFPATSRRSQDSPAKIKLQGVASKNREDNRRIVNRRGKILWLHYERLPLALPLVFSLTGSVSMSRLKSLVCTWNSYEPLGFRLIFMETRRHGHMASFHRFQFLIVARPLTHLEISYLTVSLRRPA